MNAMVRAPDRWSRPRWVGYVTLAFALHIGFIFAFGNRKPVPTREVIYPPTLQLATRRSELQALGDPTLFAGPHPQGFAGASWLQFSEIEFTPFRWSEPPRLLPLPVAELGATFLRYAQTNIGTRLVLEALPPPVQTKLEIADLPTAMKQRSTVRINGDLIERPWLNAPAILPSWPAPDVLTNSIVQVLADADGSILSTALMPPGSGSKPADQRALDIARAARFVPVARAKAKLTVGTFIFEWHTVPLPDTNAPSIKP